MSGQITAEQIAHLSKSDIIRNLDDLVLKRGSGEVLHEGFYSSNTVWTFGGEGLVVHA